MKRAPERLPADGKVECTDSMTQPIAALVGAAVGAAVTVYAMQHPKEVLLDHAGFVWVPLVATASVTMAVGAGLGHSYAAECRDAKQRGAALAQRNEERAKARAEANALS